MIKKYIGFVVIVSGLIFLVGSCRHEPPITPGGDTGGNTNPPPATNNCNPDSVYFENDILPLLGSSCGIPGCHDAATQTEGINVTSYTALMNSGIIKPGNPGGSDLVDVINETRPDKVMPPPPNAKLSQEQINKLTKWIQQGALNNKCNSGCDTSKFTFAAAVKPIIDLRCKGCHSGTAPSGGISLTTHPEIKTQADAGYLEGVINHTQGFSAMPKNLPKMPDCEIQIISKWIKAGALNN